MQAKKVRITAVGIGKKIYEEELKKIAGENVYLADDFEDLSNLYKILMEEICSKFLIHTFSFVFNALYLTYNLLYYLTVLKSGEGLIK